jgi:hypothetical protein
MSPHNLPPFHPVRTGHPKIGHRHNSGLCKKKTAARDCVQPFSMEAAGFQSGSRKPLNSSSL